MEFGSCPFGPDMCQFWTVFADSIAALGVAIIVYLFLFNWGKID